MKGISLGFLPNRVAQGDRVQTNDNLSDIKKFARAFQTVRNDIVSPSDKLFHPAEFRVVYPVNSLPFFFALNRADILSSLPSWRKCLYLLR
jgi:hypothetical protein